MCPSHPRKVLIRFDGDWSTTDRGLVQQAIEHVSFLAPWGASASKEFSWLCVHQKCGDRSFFFAHWLHRPLVLNAPSIEAFVDEISALTPEDFS